MMTETETNDTPDAGLDAEIGALTGAAAAVRDIIRLSWQGETISSAEVQDIAAAYGLVGTRSPSADEIAAGCAADEVMVEMTPVFAGIVDNLDAADAAAAEGEPT